MKQIHDVLNVAENNGLTVIEITKGINGYPQGLGDKGVIGFDTFSEAEDFAKKYGGIVSHFHRKDGWQLWENKGWANKPYTSSDLLNDMGDDYGFANIDPEYIIEELRAVSDNFDAIEQRVSELKKIVEEVEASNDDEDVIIYKGCYHSTVKKETMGCYYDTHQYAIGVLFSK